MRELVNKQAFGAAGSWPSENRRGEEIEGSVGTTSIRDLEPDGSYLIEGREQGLIDAAKDSVGGRSRLTAPERVEVTAIEATTTEVTRARALTR